MKKSKQNKMDWKSEFEHQLDVNWGLSRAIMKDFEKRMEKAATRKCKYCKKGVVCGNCCEKYGKL